MSTERAARTPSASPSTNSVEPPPMSTTRNGGRGGAEPWAAAARVQRGGGAEEGQLGLLVAGDDVGRLAEGGDAPCPRSRRGWRRPGWRWWPPCAPPSRPRSRAGAAYSASTRRVRSMASGASRPVASTPCAEPDDLHPAQQVGVRAVGRDVGDQQADRVGAAVDRGDPGHASSSRLGAGAGRPPLPHLGDRAVADRVDARPGGERVPGQGVQALDPVGHAAGGRSGWAARRGRRGWPGRRRARRGSRPASSGSVASSSCHSRIRPADSSRLAAAVARGQVR